MSIVRESSTRVDVGKRIREWRLRRELSQAEVARLAGIEVVRLDGHRLSWFESFERFSAYLHIPASMFVGLIDLWHDPNRRLAHDRAAHTAVLRRA